MRSINFTHIAASCRQAYNGVRRPVIVLESCFNMSPSQIPQMIRFFYEDERLEERLRDEDLREIFFLLTDLFPSEIDPDPDLVNMISQLSEVDETTTSLAFVQSQMAKMLEAEDNKVRAMIMRLILKRMTARDAYFVILRLVRRANPFKRSHVISALSNHFSHPTSRLYSLYWPQGSWRKQGSYRLHPNPVTGSLCHYPPNTILLFSIHHHRLR